MSAAAGMGPVGQGDRIGCRRAVKPHRRLPRSMCVLGGCSAGGMRAKAHRVSHWAGRQTLGAQATESMLAGGAEGTCHCLRGESHTIIF